jgi:signal transduction histidine kinase
VSLAWLRRAALGAALAIAALLVELGLDEVVGPQPWHVISFVAVLLATVIGGTSGGGTAALAGWFFNALVVPALVPTGPVQPVLDAVNHGVAFVLGSTLVPARRIASSARNRLAYAATAERGAQPGMPGHLVETIVRVIDELGAARSPAQVADSIARGFGELSGAVSTRVYVRATGDEPLVQRARVGAASGGPDRIEAADEGPLGRAARTGRSISLDERLVIPVRRGDEVLAVVDLDGVPEPPTVQVQAVAASLARLAGDAIGRQRLQAERRIAGDEASAASDRVAVLGRLAARLAGAATVEAVGAVLVEQSVAALGAEFGLLYERDRRSAACTLVEAKGYPVGLAEREATIAPDADGPVAAALRFGRPVEVASPDAWRRQFPGSSNTLTMTGTRALMALPLGEGGETAGVLVLGWSTAAPADDRRSVLGAIVDQGAQALERARLHAQERDAHRLQEAFVSVISHELRTPITTILAGSRILRRRVGSAPLAADLASDIESEADRLSRIVEDLLVLSRLERRNLEIAQEPVHLAHLVERVVTSESRRWPNRTFVGPGRVDVAVARGEETYVEQVLRNLLSNAAKYSPEGSTVEVAIEADGQRTTVRVLDEGPGIAREEIHKLFTLFYRSPSTAAAAAGAGIGLFVARRLVDEMGGEMWVRARDGVGSEFGFSLTTFPADEDDDDAPGGGALGEAGGAGAARDGTMRGGDGPDAPATRADSGATVG